MVCVHSSSCLLSGRYTWPRCRHFPLPYRDVCRISVSLCTPAAFPRCLCLSPATEAISRDSDNLPSPCNYSDPSLPVGIRRKESVREPCCPVTELVSELRWHGEEFRCILIGLGGLKRSCVCLLPVSVEPCVLEEQPQPWGALQHTIHCTSPKNLLLLQWIFLMLLFGVCKSLFHIQEGAEGQQCSGAVCPCLQKVTWTGSSQPGSGDGNLNFQQYCSTGQN